MYANTLHLHLRALICCFYGVSFEFFESGSDGNIEGARVLIQRGTWLNPQSKELWLQCFALYYWMKVAGCAIVLKLEPQPNLSMPAKIILRNAIKEIPDGVNFRLEFLRIDSCERH